MERYFLGNNSAYGFWSNYENELKALKRVYLLKGGPGTGKSSMLKKIANVATQKGYDCELWFCSGDPHSLDGVLIKDLQIAVVDATAPHASGADLPVMKDVIFDLATSLDKNKLLPHQKEIISLVNIKKHCFMRAYQHLKCALCHNHAQIDIEKECVNASGVRKIAHEFATANNLQNSVAKRTRMLFCKAICPSGEGEYFDHLKGKTIFKIAGCDFSKSVFFDELTKVYPANMILLNALDPNIVDGAIYGDIAIVGECFDECEIVDLSSCENIKYQDDINEEKSAVTMQIGLAVDCLNRARESHLLAEKHFVSAMDFDNNDKILREIVFDIFES